MFKIARIRHSIIYNLFMGPFFSGITYKFLMYYNIF